MIERALDLLSADHVAALIVAILVATASLLIVLIVLALCWLNDQRRSRIKIADEDDEPLGPSALPRSIELAVEEAFYRAATPDHIARAFSTRAKRLTADDVEAIWRDAKIAGRLPDLRRPRYRDRARFVPADRVSDIDGLLVPWRRVR